MAAERDAPHTGGSPQLLRAPDRVRLEPPSNGRASPLHLEGPNPWQVRQTRVVYDNGRFRVHEDDVVQPNGQPGQYVYISTPAQVVAVVPIEERAGAPWVYLVRQWRYPWRQNSWEIPAGHVEPGEDTLVAAQRELAEEVGLQADAWQSLGLSHSSAALNTRFEIFLARGLRPTADGTRREASEHDMIARAVPLATAVEAAMDGSIMHAVSIANILRAARLLGV